LKSISLAKPLEIVLRYEGVPDKQTGRIFSVFDAVPEYAAEAPMPTAMEIRAFDNAAEQYGFIVAAIERALRAGFAPEDIVIVLPDPKMKRLLIALDRNRMFSYAMGLDFGDSLLYSFLLICTRLIKGHADSQGYRREDVVEFLQHPIVKNQEGQVTAARTSLKSVMRSSRLILPVTAFCQGEGIRRVFDHVNSVLQAKASYPKFLLSLARCVDHVLDHLDQDFAASIGRSAEFSESRKTLQKNLLQEAAMPWEPFRGEDEPLVHMEYLMRQLEALSVNDVAGGFVTVMGMLETRHIPFKVVIIPDMNESVIPPRSEKDLFLNTGVRQYLGIPDYSDRENLVRSYFMSLIKNASMVFLSYVDRDDRGIRSRFVEEIIADRVNGNEDPYWLRKTEHARALTFARQPRDSHHRLPEAILAGESEMRRISRMTLTPTMLKTLRECPYRFFLMHVTRLREPREARPDLGAADIGIIVHAALRNVYSAKARFATAAALHEALREEIREVARQGYDAVWVNPQARFELDMVTERMGTFADREMERFEQGWTPRYLEHELHHELAGFRLAGRVDRVDVRHGDTGLERAYIIDYKFSSAARRRSFRYDSRFVEFQLPLYRIMLQSRYPRLVIEGFGYYDLKSKCELVHIAEEDTPEKFRELLSAVLDDLGKARKEFMKTKDLKICAKCEFVRICGRMRR
ncbi:MAG: PD-(D/E)XK nuclease family protein, partial [Thermodesulfovibrionales bacterium]